MVACAQAGADAVDAATDSMSGMTSQPSIGAILASLEGSDIDTGLDANQVRAIDSYWAQTRLTYSPFEAGLTGPDSGKLLSRFSLFMLLSCPYEYLRHSPWHLQACSLCLVLAPFPVPSVPNTHAHLNKILMALSTGLLSLSP